MKSHRVSIQHQHSGSHGSLGSPRLLQLSPPQSFDTKSKSIHQSSITSRKNFTFTLKSEQNFFRKQPSMEITLEKYANHYGLINHLDPIETFQMPLPVPPDEQIICDIKQESPLQIIPLYAEESNKIYIHRFRFQYYSLRLKDHDTPLQIYFRSDNFSNIKIYGSTTATHPNKFNAEFMIQSKYFKYLDKYHSDQFSESFMYLAFYSKDDVDIILYYEFGTKFQKKQNRTSRQFDPEKYRKLLKNMQFTQSTDKIKQNLDTTKFQKDMKLKQISESHHQLEVRIKNAKTRSIQQQSNRKLELVCKLQANDQLKEIREKQKIQYVRQQSQIRFQTVWINSLILVQFVTKLKDRLAEYKRRSKLIGQGRLIAWIYKTRMLVKIKESGHTLNERCIFKSMLLMRGLCQMSKSAARLHAGKAIHYFLRVTHLYVMVVYRHDDMTKKVNYVKRAFRNLKLKQKAYKDRLFRLLTKEAQLIFKQELGIVHLNQKKKPVQIQIDIITLHKLMEAYIKEKKRRVQQYIIIQNENKDQARKTLDLAINLMQPQIFDQPSWDDLIRILKQYAIQKKLITQ